MIHINPNAGNVEITGNFFNTSSGYAISAGKDVKNVHITENVIFSKGDIKNVIVQNDTEAEASEGIQLGSDSKVKGMFMQTLSTLDNYTKMKHGLMKKSFTFKVIKFLKLL